MQWVCGVQALHYKDVLGEGREGFLVVVRGVLRQVRLTEVCDVDVWLRCGDANV